MVPWKTLENQQKNRQKWPEREKKRVVSQTLPPPDTNRLVYHLQSYHHHPHMKDSQGLWNLWWIKIKMVLNLGILPWIAVQLSPRGRLSWTVRIQVQACWAALKQESWGLNTTAAHMWKHTGQNVLCKCLKYGRQNNKATWDTVT